MIWMVSNVLSNVLCARSIVLEMSGNLNRAIKCIPVFLNFYALKEASRRNSRVGKRISSRSFQHNAEVWEYELECSQSTHFLRKIEIQNGFDLGLIHIVEFSKVGSQANQIPSEFEKIMRWRKLLDNILALEWESRQNTSNVTPKCENVSLNVLSQRIFWE